jgi:hypothetical protein
VRLTLESLDGSPGDFEMPFEGESLRVRSIGDGHPITDFTLNLSADSNGNNRGNNNNGQKFKNTHWSFYSNDDGNEFEMHIDSPSKCQDGSYQGDIELSLYFFDGGSDSGQVHEWNNSIDPGPTEAVDVDCAENRLLVDFTNTNSELIYGDIPVTGSNNKWCFGDRIKTRDVQDFHLTPHGTVHDDDPVAVGDRRTVNFTVNHYMSRMGPEFDLTVKDGKATVDCASEDKNSNSGNIDEGDSSGRLEFEAFDAPRFLKYLHVTENRIDISLD